MGNPQHLEWLLEGVEAWNARRKRSPFAPDLSNMNVRQAFEVASRVSNVGRIPLAKVDFRSANLSASDFRGANLREADLSGANLHLTNLRNGNLFKAKIGGGAVLRNADMTSANLAGADLWRADLRQALLSKVNFTEADLTETDLRTTSNVEKELSITDLRDSRGLNPRQLGTARGDQHVMLPSHLDRPAHWLLAIVLGPSEERKLDWPEHQQDESVSALREDQDRLFLSYAHADQPQAQSLRELLQAEDIPVWWDQEILGGEKWRDRLLEELERAAVVLTVWTEAAVASDGVREEATRAQAAGKLVHTRLDDTELPWGFGEAQHVDLRQWDGTSSDPAFRKLVLSIKDKIEPPSDAEKAARLRGGSPVAPTRADGQMRLADTPLNTPPPKDDPGQRAALLKELWENTDDLADWVAATGQLPEQIEPALRFFAAIRDRESPTWTALSFRRDALTDVLAEYPDLDLSHETLCKRLKALMQSVADLEAYINPMQAEPGAPDAKPVQTDPILRRSDFEEIGTRMEALGAVFQGADAVAALEPATHAFLVDAVTEAMQAARKTPFGERSEAAQFDTLRASIKRVTYGVGALTAAEQTKRISKLLSSAAEEAFERLAAELEDYFAWLLTYF